MPAISVIMSVYNGEAYLKKGIDSIINQTFKDWEFIICDDGSTDSTYDLLLEYAKNDSRIIVLKNDTNMGLAFSLNKCIELSQCEILARQDADDESVADRFEKQIDFVNSHPNYAIVGTAWYSINNNGEKTLVVPKREPTARQMVCVGSFMHPSWMMRKSMLEKVGFYTPGELTMRDQDYHLVMKLLANGMKIINMEEPLYLYTDDSSTFKRTKNWKRVKGLMWVRYDSYKRNKLPFWCYFAALKPFFKMITPNFIAKKYYYSKHRKK